MPTNTIGNNIYDEEYFDNLIKNTNVPKVFSYYAWLLNEGTGAGEDIINSVNELLSKRESEVQELKDTINYLIIANLKINDLLQNSRITTFSRDQKENLIEKAFDISCKTCNGENYE